MANAGGFKVLFAGVYGDRLFAYDRDYILARGYDITSLLTSRKSAILSILRESTIVKAAPESFGKDFRLLVRDRRDEWIMNYAGHITHGREKRSLSKPQFYRLKKLIYESLPIPEDSLEFRKEEINGTSLKS